MRISSLALLLGISLLSGCVNKPAQQSDPLIDRIVRTADAKYMSIENIIKVVAEAGIVYLGEKHDNPRHRQIQTEVIERLLALGKKPALAFEFFSVDQTPFLLNYLRNSGTPLTGAQTSSKEQMLRRKVGWGRERKTDWEFYISLLRLARANQLMVFGLDLPPGVRTRLQSVGTSGLTRTEQRLLFPTGFNSEAYRREMFDRLKAAHCGWGTEEYLARLYDTWVARNDAMATVITDILAEAAGSPVIIILGAGHVQHNEGVFERVAHLNPEAVQVNLGLREVSMQHVPLGDYLDVEEMDGVRHAPEHEYLWFTQRADYKDRCAQFRKRLKKKKTKS